MACHRFSRLLPVSSGLRRDPRGKSARAHRPRIGRPARVGHHQAGRLNWTDSRAEARAELVTRYLADRADGSQLIVTYRNADTLALNDEVRAVRRAAKVPAAHPGAFCGFAPSWTHGIALWCSARSAR
jgi:hypothetical protein